MLIMHCAENLYKDVILFVKFRYIRLDDVVKSGLNVSTAWMCKCF